MQKGLEFHKSQAFFAILLAFMAGVFIASFRTIGIQAELAILLIAISVGALAVYRKNYNRTRRELFKTKAGIMAGCLIAVFALGVWRFDSFYNAHSRLIGYAGTGKGGREIILNGYVNGEPDVKGNKMRLIIRARSLTAEGEEA